MSEDGRVTLVEFLTARLDEDEAVARAAIEDDRGETGGFEDAYDSLTGRTGSPLDFSPRFGDATAQMIVRYAVPARVLREVEAKRRIVAEHGPADYSGLGMKSPNACHICGIDAGISDWEYVRDSFPCPTLRHLAAVYDSHPDYDEAWRP